MKPARIAYVMELAFGILVLLMGLALPSGDLTEAQSFTLWLLLAQAGVGLTAATAIRLGLRWGWALAAGTAAITLVRIPAGVWMALQATKGTPSITGGAVGGVAVLWVTQLVVGICVVLARPWRRDSAAVA